MNKIISQNSGAQEKPAKFFLKSLHPCSCRSENHKIVPTQKGDFHPNPAETVTRKTSQHPRINPMSFSHSVPTAKHLPRRNGNDNDDDDDKSCRPNRCATHKQTASYHLCPKSIKPRDPRFFAAGKYFGRGHKAPRLPLAVKREGAISIAWPS